MGPSGTAEKIIIPASGIAPTKTMAADACPVASSFRKSGGQCCCLAKLVTTLKKCGKMVNKTRSSNSRQTSFQCRYLPLSYALNFDSGGHSSNYEDYNRFCAFKNRFLASQTAISTIPALAVSH